VTGRLRRKRPDGSGEDQAARVERLRARLADPATAWLTAAEVARIEVAVAAGRLADVDDLTNIARYVDLAAGADPARTGRVARPQQVRRIVYHASQERRSAAVVELAALTGEDGPTLAGRYRVPWRPQPRRPT
jgi:hypothetical protein